MGKRSAARSTFVLFLCGCLAISGCATTADLRKQNKTFESCFRQEKQSAMLLGALPGTLLGIGAATRGDKKGVIAGAAIAAIGAIIGSKIAWQRCLTAFPIKSQTSVVTDRQAAIDEEKKTMPVVTRTLHIDDVSAGPLVFGKDLEIAVTYTYLSDDPGKRDVKAKVFRNLLFKSPQGALQEVESSTEDTIQQGVSRTQFAIPTPSLQDATELQETKEWAFKLVVEVDGMRQEKIVPLTVSSGADISNTTPQATTPAPALAAPPAQPPAEVSMGTIHLKRGTIIYSEARLSGNAEHLKVTTAVSVLQRQVDGRYMWVHIRLPEGKDGWFRELNK